ncbi:MAG: hypothetical protein S4CHLAM20_07020 [Chlamydiia bacterium]|nr:hypothetical protein [Chlamydiia bacterium]
MKIILVRHGAYTPAPEDPENGLSEAGITEVKKLSQELKSQNITFQRVLSSPKTRAMQTASILAEEKEIEITNLLDGSKDPQLTFDRLQTEDSDILLVTHNPFIGNLAALFGSNIHFHTAGCLVLENQSPIWTNN